MNELQIKKFFGYATCKAINNTYSTSFSQPEIVFKSGVNLIEGSVDSAAWAYSYVISMFSFAKKEIVLDDTSFYADTYKISLSELNFRACYLDKCCKLFKKNVTVRKQVEKAIKNYKLNIDADEIRNLFGITEFRFEQPLNCVGNEKFKCMAAIGYVNQKEVFCFPWLSKKLVPYYSNNLSSLLQTLSALNVITILPTEFHYEDTSQFKTSNAVK